MENTQVTTIEIENKIRLAEYEDKMLERGMRMAEIMAQSTVTIPDHLRNKPSDCLAIILKANRWNMDAYEVASKTSIVNGTMVFEAQLINAVISSSTAINGRFHYEYGGNWENIAGKVGHTKNNNNKYVPAKKWNDVDEQGLFVRVGAVLSGETEITWGEPVYLANVLTRNSPLWVTNPKQQLGYLAMKYWARFYTPDVTMGVYDREALEQPIEVRKEREINPIKKDAASALKGDIKQPQKASEPVQEAEILEPEPVQHDGVSKFQEIKQYISEITDAETYSIASAAFNDAAKNNLCLPNELKHLFDLLKEKSGN